MSKHNLLKIVLVFLFIGLLILYSLFSFNREIQHQMLFGKKLINPSDCTPDPVTTNWESCQGRDQSIMQNDLYYMIASGPANKKLCDKFKNSTILSTNLISETSNCLSSEVSNWTKYECSKINLSDFNCFTCVNSKTSGDIYYQVIAFDDMCQNVMKFSSANLLIDKIEAKFSELEKIEASENNLLSDFKRFVSNFL